MDPRTNDDDWADDDPDFPEDQELDDNEFPEEILEPGDEDELDFDAEDLTIADKFFSARQRVEIAREERWLRSVMADFDDYDEIENFAAQDSAGFSY